MSGRREGCDSYLAVLYKSPHTTKKRRHKCTHSARNKFRRGKHQNHENTACDQNGRCERMKETIVVVDYRGNRCDFINPVQTETE